MKRSALLILTAFCCVLFFVQICFSADKGSLQPIGPEAIWTEADKNIKSVFKECGSKKASDFGECFVSFMQKHGASPQAVGFARLTDNTGYLRAFREAGPVDIAYVAYPFRANTNYGYLLVNGDPPMVDVDSLKLPKEQLVKDPAYTKLVQRFPNAEMWPEDRFSTEAPVVEPLPGGGQRFVVEYRLTDLCRACKELGKAKFGFDFDANGKFLGIKLMGLEEIRTALKD
ncbi:MAG: hypothetical protein HY913_18840 [Desulfomonile tiedjei]|nr:hypothetical protein [Desulfomonile tiedjei]